MNTTDELDLAIGMLRQWLNEERIKDGNRFVTNEELHHWLDKALTAHIKKEKQAMLDTLYGIVDSQNIDIDKTTEHLETLKISEDEREMRILSTRIDADDVAYTLKPILTAITDMKGKIDQP